MMATFAPTAVSVMGCWQSGVAARVGAMQSTSAYSPLPASSDIPHAPLPGAFGWALNAGRTNPATLSHSVIGRRAITACSAAAVGGNTTKARGAKTEKPWAKTLIGGVVTIVFEMAGGHTLEILKIDKQVSNLPYRAILGKMTGQKGMAGLLDGFLPWGCLQSAIKGAVFGFGQALSLGFLSKLDFLSNQQATVLSGGCGGFVQGVVMSPALLLKTRVITHPRFRSTGGVLQTTIASGKLGGEIIAKEGMGVLTKGMGVFAFKRFCDWTTRYLFVEIVATAMKGGDVDKSLSTPAKMFSALAGGTLSALVTVPIDVMVATIQDAGKSGKKVSVVQVLKAQFQSGGIGDTIRFSTRGLAARVAHVAMTTLMMKTVTSWVYDQTFRN